MNGKSGVVALDLAYEKTGILMEIEYDQEARHLSDEDRKLLRARLVEINKILGALR